MQRSILGCCSFLILLAVGCGVETETTVSTQPVQLKIPASLESHLVAADRLDGQEDKVIHRCYTCSLNMDGRAEFSVDVNGYTAHFCTERCCQHFSSEAESVIDASRNKTSSGDEGTDEPAGDDAAADGAEGTPGSGPSAD